MKEKMKSASPKDPHSSKRIRTHKHYIKNSDMCLWLFLGGLLMLIVGHGNAGAEGFSYGMFMASILTMGPMLTEMENKEDTIDER